MSKFAHVVLVSTVSNCYTIQACTDGQAARTMEPFNTGYTDTILYCYSLVHAYCFGLFQSNLTVLCPFPYRHAKEVILGIF
jgi:hypothetical protein